MKEYEVLSITVKSIPVCDSVFFSKGDFRKMTLLLLDAYAFLIEGKNRVSIFKAIRFNIRTVVFGLYGLLSTQEAS